MKHGALLGTCVCLAWIIGTSTSCRKKTEAAEKDLGTAGYAMNEEGWFRASRENDKVSMAKFVEAGFAFDTRNAAGDSALHEAATHGAENSAKFLLDRGMSVNVLGANQATPLHRAVAADQTAMVDWLLKQGADPNLKDAEGYIPLMTAVREGRPGSVEILAPYHRDQMDDALLLAAMIGRADVIDSLTNFGASVYAKLDDGRTPLMVAAENGHSEAVALLLDIGASRHTTDPLGRTAADFAAAAGHRELAASMGRPPTAEELALESTEDIGRALNFSVERALVKSGAAGVAELVENAAEQTAASASEKDLTDAIEPDEDLAEASLPLEGQVLSRKVSAPAEPRAKSAANAEQVEMPPLVMRAYHQRELPLVLKEGEDRSLKVAIKGREQEAQAPQVGQNIPGSRLQVLRVYRRMEDSKLTDGAPVEVAVMEVQDSVTGEQREWTSGNTIDSHDPVALVEDAATGRRYVAAPGQKFRSEDGTEYSVTDVRPNQLIIEETATGAVQTLPLRGPRG